MQWDLGDMSNLSLGVVHDRKESNYFAEIIDLLGAGYHLDIEPFSGSRNDIEGPLRKNLGQRFGYNYNLGQQSTTAYLQWQIRNHNGDYFWPSRVRFWGCSHLVGL